jgi:uncharacterized protein (DUF736 family)
VSQGNYDNSNRGALFKNKDKRSENDPDYRGSINVAEDEYWLSAWLKTSKAGEKYMSLSVQPKTPKQTAPKVESKSDDFDDDLPF